MKLTVTLFFILSGFFAHAQETLPDTTRQEEVVVKGFETGRPLLTTATTAFIISLKEISRNAYPNTSLVPLVNQAPGVRMEERSPGSYRLSIRGSLLRSPFGVRNIKVYLAGIPFTDAGGNTYINLLDVNMIRNIEILKGASGVTYGAGTGGTLLLNDTYNNRNTDKERFNASFTAGAYNTYGEYLNYWKNTGKNGFNIQQSHLQSDGYREHSFLRRDAVTLQAVFNPDKKNQWNIFFLYGNLHYETPGGITLEQMMANPKLSRQRTGAIPSAIEQNAGIYQQTIFTGASNKHTFNERWNAATSVFFAYTDFANPFITNYETRFEKSGGARSVFYYTSPSKKLGISTGVEAAVTGSQVTNFGNRGGQKDTLQNKDLVDAVQGFVFANAQLNVTENLLIEAGSSVNHFAYQYDRIFPVPGEGKRTFDLQFLPRLAVLYKFINRFSIYSNISRGYSPPTIAEVRPDNQVLNTGLQPEAGTNIETGFRGSFFNGRLFTDVAAYYFRLKNTIVRRTAASGDFFVNAGSTKQKGIEIFIHSLLVKNKTIDQLKLFTSITLNHYRFGQYAIGSAVYDGNRITGVPGKIITVGADLGLTKGWYINTTATYISSIPLTDDNTITAESFYLLNSRAGYRYTNKKTTIDIFIAGNNLLDELYSPGNDLNAPGRRYYNPGAKRNFVGGVMLKL